MTTDQQCSWFPSAAACHTNPAHVDSGVCVLTAAALDSWQGILCTKMKWNDSLGGRRRPDAQIPGQSVQRGAQECGLWYDGPGGGLVRVKRVEIGLVGLMEDGSECHGRAVRGEQGACQLPWQQQQAQGVRSEGGGGWGCVVVQLRPVQSWGRTDAAQKVPTVRVALTAHPPAGENKARVWQGRRECGENGELGRGAQTSCHERTAKESKVFWNAIGCGDTWTKQNSMRE